MNDLDLISTFKTKHHTFINLISKNNSLLKTSMSNQVRELIENYDKHLKNHLIKMHKNKS